MDRECLEAGKFCVFGNRIMQYGKILFGTNLEQMMSKKHSSLGLTDPNFAIWEKILIKSLKISHF